jgi:hypothetical protein
MSGESLVALAVCHAPQFDGVVPRPSGELPRIRRVELEAGDAIAANFSNVSFTCNLYASSPLSGEEAWSERRQTRYCNDFADDRAELETTRAASSVAEAKPLQ